MSYVLAATTADLTQGLVHWQPGIAGACAVDVVVPRPAAGPRVTVHLLHATFHGLDCSIVLQPFYGAAPLPVAEPLFAACAAVHTLAMGDRHAYFRGPFFAALLGVVAARVSFARLLAPGAAGAGDPSVSRAREVRLQALAERAGRQVTADRSTGALCSVRAALPASAAGPAGLESPLTAWTGPRVASPARGWSRGPIRGTP
jgi:hypothetical protein